MITWFSCTAAFGYQTAPEEFCSTDENLSGQFVHTGPFNIFALFKQNWGTRLNFNFCLWFCHLPCAKCWFSKFKMASPSWVSTHQCTHAFTVHQFRRLSSHLASHAGLFRGARIWPPQKRLLNPEQHFPLFYSRGKRPINSFKSNIC